MRTVELFSAISLCLVVSLSACVHQEEKTDESRFSGDKFSEHVRSTDPRTPEEERRGFKLPPGFEITLFASEPDIGKPMNISFDAKGRMWVTQSFEYPFPAKGQGKDRITILEDTDRDGKADKFTHFTDTLNIPIGILPYENGAIAYSIPNVYRFSDADDNGAADGSQILLGPFQHKDTHGMVNNFTWGFDGWVYADHGFTNRSTVAGKDGDSITMESGNTFRFRPDGSRVEQTTYGRVNPFGLAFDELGYLYSVDCHSSPIYQLIRGADYPHFGKQPQGIGFAPDTKPHGEESTALAGLAYYSMSAFPEAFQKNLFIGDVVTCRVHRYSFEFKGSTPVATAEHDLVMSEDPWFRPVDVKLGPDGALYIADFYNRVIGHYEVPLDHPGRDRVSGRIWRITYKGNTEKVSDWTSADLDRLLEGFRHPNLKVRLKVANELVFRIGRKAVEPLEALIGGKDTGAQQYIHALWALYRLSALDDQSIQAALQHEDPLVRIHALRILAAMDGPAETLYQAVSAALSDYDPHVQRAAVEALTRYGRLSTVKQLVDFRDKIPGYDTHLLYTTRLCLRNLLRNDKLLDEVAAGQWDDRQSATLADAMTGVDLVKAGSFLFSYMEAHTVSNDQLTRLLKHAARFVPERQLERVITYSEETYGNDKVASYQAYTAIRDGLRQRGAAGGGLFEAWGSKLATAILTTHFSSGAQKPAPVPSNQEISRQRFAVEFAGNHTMTQLEGLLKTALGRESADRGVRVNAARSLMRIDDVGNVTLLGDVLAADSADLELRKQIAVVLGEFPGERTRALLGGIKRAPPALQAEVVKALIKSPEGLALVFENVKKGDIFPRTLLDQQVKQQLPPLSATQQQMYDSLTAAVPPVSEEKQALIWTRAVGFSKASKADSMVVAGKKVFAQYCAPCHTIEGKGGMIGPQLTGIGNWGAGALAEKILDPNRNVSASFRNYIVQTKDGRTLTGLFRREEGETMIFADVTGKEFALSKTDIVSREPAEFTLMPDNFGEVLSQDEFNKLISYLLTQK